MKTKEIFKLAGSRSWNRVVFSGAKMRAGQIRRGEGYGQIERVASIIICGDTLLHEEPGYLIPIASEMSGPAGSLRTS
jgi:hypothetical protein